MVFGQNFSSISSLIGTLEGEGATHLESPSSATRTTLSRTNSNGVKSSTTTNTSILKSTGNDGLKRTTTTTTTTTNATNNHTRPPQPVANLISKTSSSALSTFTPTLSRALDDEQSAAKRRRIDGEGSKEQSGAKDVSTVPAKRQLTREEKIAILKKRKMKEKMAAMEGEKAKNGGANGSSSCIQKPPALSGTTTKAPAKGSYAEVLARAKAMQETAVSLQPTKIVHKHHKVEKDKTTWQKKMADKKADKGNSVSNTEGERSKMPRKPTNVPPPTNGKRPTTMATSRTKSATSTSTIKKLDLSQPVKRKREEEVPKIEWKGTARGVSVASVPSRGKPQARERERERSPPRKSYQPRYVYRDDSDDFETDESDMEAAPLEIEDEEEYSGLAARKEDVEEEKREKERQRIKLLAKKRALSGKA